VLRIIGRKRGSEHRDTEAPRKREEKNERAGQKCLLCFSLASHLCVSVEIQLAGEAGGVYSAGMDSGRDVVFPRAILFDMDGTLTEPMLDFAAIKREMGIGEVPILEAMGGMDEEGKARANAVLDRHETQAAEESVLNAGCEELLQWIHGRRIRTAIITRNSRRCAEIVVGRHGLKFEVVITREEGKFKPDPTPLLRACERLGVPVEEAWMVGDGQYDVEAGIAAGVRTVWVSHGRERGFEAEPWRVVRNLGELVGILKTGTQAFQ
jgi:HAD superfamily hydrolase (TIGR01509 family)